MYFWYWYFLEMDIGPNEPQQKTNIVLACFICVLLYWIFCKSKWKVCDFLFFIFHLAKVSFCDSCHVLNSVHSHPIMNFKLNWDVKFCFKDFSRIHTLLTIPEKTVSIHSWKFNERTNSFTVHVSSKRPHKNCEKLQKFCIYMYFWLSNQRTKSFSIKLNAKIFFCLQ